MNRTALSASPVPRPLDRPARTDLPATRRELRDAALAAARAGYHVFPVIQGSKVPALHGVSSCPGSGVCRNGHQGWEQRATIDEAQIRRWWDRPFNIGIACGPSGLVVIDLDTAHGDTPPGEYAGARNGADVLARLAQQAGEPVGETMTVASPSGGIHRYYQAPAALEVRNSAGVLGWRCDVRASGGYIIGPRSRRPEGRYRVTRPGPPAILPDWLLQRLRDIAAPPESALTTTPSLELPAARAGRYLAAIIDSETDTVRSAQPGQRRATLLAAARTLGRLVGGGELTETDARAALLAAAEVHIGHHQFTQREAETTIDDALSFGMRRPRQLSQGGAR